MSSAGVSIGVLGPVLATDADAAPIQLRSPLQRLLLSVLVAASGRTVRTDELAEALWPDEIPGDPAAALQSQVSRLRNRLGDAGSWIETTPAGYRLVAPADRVDALRFDRLLRDARSTEDASTALAFLDEALSLWRGRAHVEVADHTAIAPEAARLDEARAGAVELRGEILLRLDRPGEAVTEMQAQITEQPFRERPLMILMRALAQEGRQVEALAHFDRFRRLLDEELGIEPSPELRAVERSVLVHEEPTQALAATVGVPGNSFIGRDAEVGKSVFLLDRGRLATITGPGGVGKTRMALHVAAALSSGYPDGVYLCELARVTDRAAVAAEVAATLHVAERADRALLDGLIEFLQTKHTLLVIDNCEHLSPDVGRLIAAVIARTPSVDVLATSRERLGVEGEQLVPLGPLATPAWDDPAGASVLLFTDRARAVRPDVAFDEDEVAAVCELCRRLDGLPLAIELAAAQTMSRTPAEILAALSDRFLELADERRVIERHRSLDAVFGWSYGLLEEAEQTAFQRLAIFVGGWTPTAAREVADASDAVLAALVERSLVTAQQAGGGTRFAMLEPVRQYAIARLEERESLRAAHARHAAWAVAFAAAADAGVRGPEEIAWLRAWEAELPNLRAAHRWCLENDPTASVRLAGSLYNYIRAGAPSEVFTWAEECVSRFYSEVTHPQLSHAFASAALGSCLRGDLAAAQPLAEAGIAVAVDHPADARIAWTALGDSENFLGNFERALVYYDEAIELSRGVGDHYHLAVAMCDRAMSLAYLGRFDEALEECEAFAPVVALADNPSLTAHADSTNGEARIDHAPLDALPYLRRSVAAARRIGDRLLMGLAGLSAVSCEARVGDPDKALVQYGELIDHWHRAGAWNMQWATLRTLIELLVRLGSDADAAVLYGAMNASPTAPPVAGADKVRIGQAVATARSRLGDERFDALGAEGTRLSDNDAVPFALRCVGGWESSVA